MQTVARLIQTFVPEHYALSLTLHRSERTFSGTVTVRGTSTKGAKDVRLHAKDLTIESVTFDGKEASFQSFDFDELSITHPDIAEGEHVVVVGFSGKITDAMHGLYPCYFEHDGIKKELLATQFESHYAREVFPCIDEPEAKATYDVTLTTEKDITVLGNMPVLHQKSEGEVMVTTFATTPKMSSYLLAFVVGELHKKSATTKSGVEVNIWATPAQPPESLDFALDIATRSIDFFDEYFETPYPLAKSDHVALPDFSSGAMENWGLITYREVALLADPKTVSITNKHMAATVIAHELSHQWFGNLVTMKWWNDLWLNESFANLMEYIAVDALEPSWDIWLDYAGSEILPALKRDALDGVQAIQADVNHPDEIGTLFDPSIVYAKGGRLLRMLRAYIGDQAFRSGLKAYFKKFAYQNTAADDLWQCFSEASGQDVGTFMNTWISQSGYPVVHIAAEHEGLFLTQEQFFIGPHGDSEKLWPVPLAASSDDLPPLLSTKSLSVAAPVQPVRLNLNATGHFITDYTPALLSDVLKNLKELDPIDRVELLNEQILLAQAGLAPTAQLIPLLREYRDETVEAVWDIMAIAINELKKFVETDSEAEKKLRAFVGQLAEKEFNRLGWEAKAGEPESDTKLRSLIVSLMLYSERPEIIEKAEELYTDTPIDDLDNELRPHILAAAVRFTADDSIIDALLAEHQKTANSAVQEDIAYALTATKKTEVIKRLIGLLQDTSIVRHQDFPRWFIWLMRNRYGRELMWQWTRQADSWKWIVDTFKGAMMFDSIPRYIASCLMTSQQLGEYKAFFEPLKKEPALRRNIEIGIGELTGRVELIERDGPAVRKALLNLD